MRTRRFSIAAACLALGGLVPSAVGAEAKSAEARPSKLAPAPTKAVRDARALAEVIDRLLAAKWAEDQIKPAAPASDAEFLRRIYLDLIGKIPTAREAGDFLDDPAPDKRARLVEQLLASPTYLVRATETLRSLLLPEADTDAQVRALTPTFDAWLRKRVAEDVGYDRVVREVLAFRLGGRGRRATNALDPRAEPTPIAFYEAKEGKPENLAAGTARVFLGIRLECAQCHNHPFASWKREEFWGFAAFFAGVSKPGGAEGFGSIREAAGRHELAIPGTSQIVKAAFLDSSKPRWGGRSEPREVLANWITAPDNPYFARAAVNRLWARFFGIGLVNPVDDMGEANPPSHPELLDELAKQFRTHGYDIKFVIRALTATRAYSLTSAIGRSESASPSAFAAMPVRGLSPGQLFDTIAQATGFRDGSNTMMFDDGGSARGRFLELFANRDEKPTEAQTSILQALSMMNGTLIASATSTATGDTLGAIVDAPSLTTNAERIEWLFLAALTRRPRPDEQKMLVAYVNAKKSDSDRAKALGDIFWALLNTPEFKLNH